MKITKYEIARIVNEAVKGLPPEGRVMRMTVVSDKEKKTITLKLEHKDGDLEQAMCRFPVSEVVKAVEKIEMMMSPKEILERATELLNLFGHVILSGQAAGKQEVTLPMAA